MSKKLALLTLSAFLAKPADAQDVSAYAYDALGQLIQISESQPSNSPVITRFEYDLTKNRITVETTGIKFNTFIALPLLGYVIITLP